MPCPPAGIGGRIVTRWYHEARWRIGLAARGLTLAASLLQAAPRSTRNLPDLSLVAMSPPDEGRVAPLRLLRILAVITLRFGRISDRTFPPTWPLPVGANLAGLAAMIAPAWFLDRRSRLSAGP